MSSKQFVQIWNILMLDNIEEIKRKEDVPKHMDKKQESSNVLSNPIKNNVDIYTSLNSL